MAITFDAATNLGSTGTTSLTAAHVVTGIDPILFVSVGCYQASGSGDIVTGVTYNGVAMTRIESALGFFGGNQYTANLFYLISPATGSNNVVVSLSSNNNIVYATAASYTGVDQTSPIDVSATETTTGATSISKQITTTVDSCWAFCTALPTSGTQSAGTGTTLRLPAQPTLYDNNAAISPAGNVTLVVDNDTSVNTGMIITSFKPSLVSSAFLAIL